VIRPVTASQGNGVLLFEIAHAEKHSTQPRSRRPLDPARRYTRGLAAGGER
jgi:hypothetical protein